MIRNVEGGEGRKNRGQEEIKGEGIERNGFEKAGKGRAEN